MDNKKINQWYYIDWGKAEDKVRDFQEKITVATLKKDMKKVYKLQWQLIQCEEAKVLAVRKVITNKGGKTSGIDKKIWTCPQDYWRAVEELTGIIWDPKQYRASPVRRVYIPKGNGKELRPLGIPTMIDRAMQALYHLGVDPAVEAVSDPNSYGFRKNRSTHDAITMVRSLLDKSYHPHWVLEADITKCFDKISHEFMMTHTPICHREILGQWLKSGIMEGLNYREIEEGTPQGGIMSPTLCNIALNGLEEILKERNPLKRGISPGVHLIRYADDMIVTGKSKEIVQRNKEILKEFLKIRGLELNEKKTVITHVKEGFDFLGFNISRKKWSARNNQATDQETVLVIKPSEKGIKKLKEKIRSIIKINKPILRIIKDINPVLRGWGEHKRISYHSQATFIKIDHWIYTKMKKWAYWLKGSIRKNINKYKIQTNTRKWNWGISPKCRIINLGEIPIIKIAPLNHNKNPYKKDDRVYFEKRRQNLIDAKFRAIMYKLFEHRCPLCRESLYNGELVELHHIVPQKSGGKYRIKNILPLHQICHQQITHGDRSLEKMNIKGKEMKKSKRTPKKEDKGEQTLQIGSLGEQTEDK